MSDDTATDQLFSDLTFNDVDLPDELRSAVADLGFERLTRVQAEVLPLSLEGRDIVAQAQTGSGKTAAYLLTVFSRMMRQERRSAIENPRALIIAPTRELAVQIASDAEKLASHTDFSIHVVFGGIDYKKQRLRFASGVDLLIGTPGRLIDYHRQGAYSLRDTEMVVVDECDRLFDMGFAEDLRWLLHRLPYTDKRQSLMFTATLSRRVMRLGWREMTDPAEIVINREQLTPDTVHQELYHVASHEKLSLLLGLLEREGGERIMIFLNTKHASRRLVEDLRRHGYVARALTGDVMQTKRLRVLDDFRDGRLPILVATDVASRGLHIEGVTHVINFDLPQDAEDYVHRIGRTARVGAEGKALTLACDDYVYSLDAVHAYVGYEIPVVFAPEELFAEVIPFKHTPRKPRPQGRRSGGRRHDSRPQARPKEPAAKGADGDQPKKKRRRRRRKKNPAGDGGGSSGGNQGQSR
ncbi:MAG: DEAD/DEAH box helicase [Thermoanaerobaculales bacterium]|jgi:ATP-dependent RNA helicase RhlB|nr:DEAD/DEAH box helicase [Thermoanaerobaculales bacterium]